TTGIPVIGRRKGTTGSAAARPESYTSVLSIVCMVILLVNRLHWQRPCNNPRSFQTSRALLTALNHPQPLLQMLRANGPAAAAKAGDDADAVVTIGLDDLEPAALGRLAQCLLLIGCRLIEGRDPKIDGGAFHRTLPALLCWKDNNWTAQRARFCWDLVGQFRGGFSVQSSDQHTDGVAQRC